MTFLICFVTFGTPKAPISRNEQRSPSAVSTGSEVNGSAEKHEQRLVNQ